MKANGLKTLLVSTLLSARSLCRAKSPEGIWQGYDGEWLHVSQQ